MIAFYPDEMCITTYREYRVPPPPPPPTFNSVSPEQGINPMNKDWYILYMRLQTVLPTTCTVLAGPALGGEISQTHWLDI